MEHGEETMVRAMRTEMSVAEALMSLRGAERAVFARFDVVCGEFGITSTQYQILCILRDAHPGGCPRFEITANLVDRSPDVTRAIDRLAGMGYVTRGRSHSDRRLSITCITESGLDLLRRMDPMIGQVHGYVADRLSSSESEELLRLCRKLHCG